MPRTHPAGVSSWLDLEVPDAGAVRGFYEAVLGWTLTEAMPPDSGGSYLIATVRGQDVAAIASGAAALGGRAGWNTYFAVDDAEASAGAVAAAGGRVVEPPSGNPGGVAVACADPEGATFRLWQAGQRLGAQVTNAPGTWNFSDLFTDDAAAAAGFYAEVFPWTVADGGPDAGAMIAVPEYGDHLEATVDPEIRERQAAAGTPPGFADVIGRIRPLPEGEQPHWHVTFSVADRDASAAAVESAGGGVERMGEMRWARTALVRDPVGAPFSISQFTPQA